MDYRGIITIEPGRRGGKPTIRGMSEAGILSDIPELTSEDIRACLTFAADRERRLMSFPAL